MSGVEIVYDSDGERQVYAELSMDEVVEQLDRRVAELREKR